MEYQIAYDELSLEARHAWETVNGLPFATHEQHRHAWDILCAEVAGLANDPRPGLHVVSNARPALNASLFVTGAELGALRVMVSWLKANDRAGRMRDLPIYPDLGEAIVSQLGQMPWPGVWQPGYLSQIEEGGTLWFQPVSQAEALEQLLSYTIERGATICPSWPVIERFYLLGLLADVACGLRALLSSDDQTSG
jgi:hypothetical protein